MSSATGPDHNEKTKFIHWLNSPNISTGVNQTRIIREILFSPPLFYYFLTKKNKNYQLHNLACSPHLNFKIFQLRPSRRRDYYRGYHIFYCSLYIISYRLQSFHVRDRNRQMFQSIKNNWLMKNIPTQETSYICIQWCVRTYIKVII